MVNRFILEMGQKLKIDLRSLGFKHEQLECQTQSWQNLRCLFGISPKTWMKFCTLNCISKSLVCSLITAQNIKQEVMICDDNACMQSQCSCNIYTHTHTNLSDLILTITDRLHTCTLVVYDAQADWNTCVCVCVWGLTQLTGNVLSGYKTIFFQ